MLLAAVLIATALAPGRPGPLALDEEGAGTRWYVDDDAVGLGSGTPADPFFSVTYAVARPEVQDGDIVIVLPGDYLDESIRVEGRALTIIGASGPGETRLYGPSWPVGGEAAVLVTRGPAADVDLRGLRITGGGGSLEAGGFLEPVGGAVAAFAGARVRLSDCEFEANSAERGGDVYVRDGALTVESCVFLGPGCDARGEAIFARDASVLVAGSTFQDLRTGPPGAPTGGGAVLVEQSEAALEQCTFDRNGSALFGAHVWARNSSLRVDACELRGGAAFSGGAIAVLGGDARLTDVVVSENVAVASPGGGLFASGAAVHLARCAFLGNSVDGAREGGAVALLASDLVADDTLFAGNVAHRGGALDVGVGSTARLTGCRVVRNRAAADGGATRGPVRALRSVFTENLTGTPGAPAPSGAALSGEGLLDRCTIAGNAGGDAAVRGRFVVRSTIAWANAPLDVVTTASVARSIVGTLVAPPGMVASTTDADPLLWTVAAAELLPGSPAIDALPPAGGLDPDGSAREIGADVYSVFDRAPGYAGDLGAQACEAPANSTGARATLVAIGSTSRAEDRLVVAGEGFPAGAAAVVLASTTAGTTPLPGATGPLCLAGALVRVTPEARFTRVDGTFAARIPTTRPPFSRGAGGSGGAGSTWTLQVWFRDAAGAATSGVSAARTVTLVP